MSSYILMLIQLGDSDTGWPYRIRPTSTFPSVITTNHQWLPDEEYVTIDGTYVVVVTDTGSGNEPHIWTPESLLSQLSDIYAGATGSDPAGLTVFNSHVYFAATDESIGRELYRASTTTVELVADVLSGADSGDVSHLAVIGDSLYFAATSSSAAGKELHRATAAGDVSLVVDATAGSGDTSFGSLPGGVSGTSQYICGGTVGSESGLHVFDVSSETHSFVSLDPAGAANVGDVVVLGNNAYFSGAKNGDREVYQYNTEVGSAFFADMYSAGSADADQLYVAEGKVWAPGQDGGAAGLFMLSEP